MFPLSLLQSSYSPVCVCGEPGLSLWSATRLMVDLLEGDLMNKRKDMDQRMQRVNQVYKLLAEDIEQRANLLRSSADTDGPASTTGKEGKENFELILDTSGFSPEELKVKTEGRRLIVSGKHEEKMKTENGGYSHEFKEWRREADLPLDINPKDILCSLSKDGQLYFQAPRLALPAAEERPIPITHHAEDGQRKQLENQNPEGENGQDSS